MASVVRPSRSRGSRQAQSSTGLSYTEPQRAQLILAATALTTCAVLLVWMIVAALIPAVRGSNVFELAVGSPEAIGAMGANPAAEVSRRIDDFLARLGSRPAVIVLRAEGVSRSGGAAKPDAFLLCPTDAPGLPPIPVSMADLLKIVARRDAAGPTLLILDAEVSPGDRALGVFGNAFFSELKPLLQDHPTLAVLTACAEGQSTAWIEGAGTTVFGQYVAEALSADRPGAWEQFQARELLDYVRPRVASWVKANRDGAEQTPELLGDPELLFRLTDPPPAPVASNARPAADDAISADEKALQEEWTRHATRARQNPAPYHEAPREWQAYERELLRAERLHRRGDTSSSRLALASARDRAARMRTPAAANGTEPASLALLRMQGPEGRNLAEVYEENLDRLLRLLAASRTREPQPDPAPVVPVEPAAPKDGPTPKEEPGKSDPADNPSPKPAAPAKPAPPPPVVVAGLAETLWALTLDRDPVRPKYVEGQWPVWYAEFARRGGETEALREERIRLLRQVVEVHQLAERAATLDPRMPKRLRTLVEEGDAIRREAQDGLFANTPQSLAHSSARLSLARSRYQEALVAGETQARNLAVLERVRATLPAYADWAARAEGLGRAALDQGPLELLRAVASSASKLSHQIDDPQANPESIEPTRLAVEQALTSLESEFQTRVRVTRSWREIDALLRVPAIPPAERQRLRQRARELSPVAPFGETIVASSAPDTSPFDERFLVEALALADAEAELLRIDGRDLPEIDSAIGNARHAWKLRAGTAFAFDSLASLLASARQAAAPTSAESSTNPNDWASWYARRIDAESIVDRPTGGVPVQLDVADNSSSQENLLNVVVRGLDSLPDHGRAAVFLAHDPVARVNASTDPTNLVDRQSGTESTLRFQIANHEARAVAVTPVAFFRGRFFDGPSGRKLPHSEFVRVEIHSADKIQLRIVSSRKPLEFNLPDQFLDHPNRGYYHPGTNLDFWLKITNTSPGRLSIHVSRDLDGARTERQVILDPGASTSKTDLVGQVIANRPRQRMLVTVREGDARGRDLCEPFQVDFEQVDPAAFIVPERAQIDRNVLISVYHKKDDPAPFPVQVTFNCNPADAVREQSGARLILMPGDRPATHNYLIIKDVKALDFTCKVNGKVMPQFIERVDFQELRDKPADAKSAPRPPDPNSLPPATIP